MNFDTPFDAEGVADLAMALEDVTVLAQDFDDDFDDDDDFDFDDDDDFDFDDDDF